MAMKKKQRDLFQNIIQQVSNLFCCDVFNIYVPLDKFNHLYIDRISYKDGFVTITDGTNTLSECPIEIFSDVVIDNILSAFGKEVEKLESEMDNFNDSQYYGKL